MTIDWFTVIAQIINFLILVWLLKKFLYKPILDAVDERERKIVSKIEDANKKELDAAQERDKFKEKNSEFDIQRKKNWEQALLEINNERQQQFEKVRKETSELQQKLDTQIVLDQESLMNSLKLKTQQEVLLTVKKTLKDLANEDLENNIISVFVKKLKKLSKEEKEKLLEHFSASKSVIEIHSAFDLQKHQKESLQKTVSEILGSEITFEYKIESNLMAGIELNANSYKISWSIDEYLQSFEKILSEVTQDSKSKLTKPKHTNTDESK